jgi:NTP pyrophosphatase (non-canonical NTP hydrolase)
MSNEQHWSCKLKVGDVITCDLDPLRGCNVTITKDCKDGTFNGLCDIGGGWSFKPPLGDDWHIVSKAAELKQEPEMARHWSYDLKVGDWVYDIGNRETLMVVGTRRVGRGQVLEKAYVRLQGGEEYKLPLDDDFIPSFMKDPNKEPNMSKQERDCLADEFADEIIAKIKDLAALSSTPSQPNNLNNLRDEAHATAKSKGWHEAGNDWSRLPELLVMVHSEVSEVVEAYRKDQGNGIIASELADIIIRVLDIAGLYDIDLGWYVRTKMEHNKTRPYRHGGKLV